MKKKYILPDLEIVTFRLTDTILSSPTENNATPGGGSIDGPGGDVIGGDDLGGLGDG